ncbi:hypothetical protein BKD26_31490 [Streptomyces sp. CB03238]|nr:hypothetical protein BKD26_31490 [Streptomyces sp. CB03238]
MHERGLHRPCPPARRRRPQKGGPAGEPDDHALGRSRGGLTTKVHLAADGRCRPLGTNLTVAPVTSARGAPQPMRCHPPPEG